MGASYSFSGAGWIIKLRHIYIYMYVYVCVYCTLNTLHPPSLPLSVLCISTNNNNNKKQHDEG